MPEFRLAVYPGDGIGPEVIDEALRVLDAVERAEPGLKFQRTVLPWGIDYYDQTGKLVPDDFLDVLRPFDAILLGAVGLVAVLGIGYALTRKPAQPEGPGGAAPKAIEVTPFSGLDALYASWKEPLPPATCRRVEDAPRLAAIATDATALGLVDANPESAYLLARATFEKDRSRHPALDKALACPGFAAPSNLAGRAALVQKDYEQARKHFLAAIAAAPTFVNARFNLALMYVQAGDLDSAKDKLDNLLSDNPDFGDALLVRAGISQLKGDHGSAKADACKAAKLGLEKAKAECDRLSGSP